MEPYAEMAAPGAGLLLADPDRRVKALAESLEVVAGKVEQAADLGGAQLYEGFLPALASRCRLAVFFVRR